MGCSPRDPPCEGPPPQSALRGSPPHTHCALERGRAPLSELRLKLRTVSGPDGGSWLQRMRGALKRRPPHGSGLCIRYVSESAQKAPLWAWRPLPAQRPLPGHGSHPAGEAGLGEPQVRFTELSGAACVTCIIHWNSCITWEVERPSLFTA